MNSSNNPFFFVYQCFISLIQSISTQPTFLEVTSKLSPDVVNQVIPIFLIVSITYLFTYQHYLSTQSTLDFHERWLLDELRFRNTSSWAENEADLINISKVLWKLISSSHCEAPEIIKRLVETRSGVSNLTVEQKTEICYDVFRTMKKYEEHLKLGSAHDITPIVIEALHHLSLMNLHLAFEVSNYMVFNFLSNAARK